MKISQIGRNHLVQIEGCRLRAYTDLAGKRTIGIGHLLTASENESGRLRIGDLAVDWRHGITADQVHQLLDQDLDHAEEAVTERVTVSLTQHQFDALVSFVFNVGSGAFARSALLRHLNAGNYAAVPEQLRRWVRAGGRVSRGLRRRRELEIALWNCERAIQ